MNPIKTSFVALALAAASGAAFAADVPFVGEIGYPPAQPQVASTLSRAEVRADARRVDTTSEYLQLGEVSVRNPNYVAPAPRSRAEVRAEARQALRARNAEHGHAPWDQA